MPPVQPSSGPIAVTGASGYIGSWVVDDLAKHGYTVHACVRDISLKSKVDHLLAMNEKGYSGCVKLFAADLFKSGSYDEAFKGCVGIVHAAAAVGYNKETPQQVYDGCFTQNEHVVASAVKTGSVKRFVFTSSCAAIVHPHPEKYVFTESDWCDQERDPEKWRKENIPTNRDLAYAMAKAASERWMNDICAKGETGFDVISVLPSHVIGPLICTNHDQGWSWQNCIKQMLQGKPYTKSAGGRMLWNIVDVRDVAISHRLCLASDTVKNGSRYILGAADPSAELFTWQLQKRLQGLFPSIPVIGGEEMDGDKPKQDTQNPPYLYCTKAIKELGLEPIKVEATLKDTGDSLITLGLI